MLVEKYEPSGGEYLYAVFGHRAGLVPSKHIEILNIQKGSFPFSFSLFFFFFCGCNNFLLGLQFKLEDCITMLVGETMRSASTRTMF